MHLRYYIIIACCSMVQPKISHQTEVKAERNDAIHTSNSSKQIHRRQYDMPLPPKMSDLTVWEATTRQRKPPPLRPAFDDECDHILAFCMRAYVTGAVCARTLFFRYRNFTKYCEVDWTNCKLRYDVWQIVHMGPCFKYTIRKDCNEFTYRDNMEDMWLDQLWLNKSS